MSKRKATQNRHDRRFKRFEEACKQYTEAVVEEEAFFNQLYVDNQIKKTFTTVRHWHSLQCCSEKKSERVRRILFWHRQRQKVNHDFPLPKCYPNAVRPVFYYLDLNCKGCGSFSVLEENIALYTKTKALLLCRRCVRRIEQSNQQICKWRTNVFCVLRCLGLLPELRRYLWCYI